MIESIATVPPWAMTLTAALTVVAASASGALWLRGSGAALAARLPLLLALALGVLLGDAFIHLLPHAWRDLGAAPTAMLCAAGFGLFAVLGRLLPHRHRHGNAPALLRDSGKALPVTLWGDGLHNAMDGVLLALAFSASPVLGLATWIGLLAHELPQEWGDLAVLVASGERVSRAVALNLISALAIVPGALLGLWLGEVAASALGWLVPVVAGGFVYLAMFVLTPALRRACRRRPRGGVRLAAVGAAGIAAMGGLAVLEARLGLEHGHVHWEAPSAPARPNFAPWVPASRAYTAPSPTSPR